MRGVEIGVGVASGLVSIIGGILVFCFGRHGDAVPEVIVLPLPPGMPYY